MNYRHIYHAGNQCDIFKHLIYIEILKCMNRKDKPFAVLDTHAGLGIYDLNSEQAQKTNEAELGIKRISNINNPSFLVLEEIIYKINDNEIRLYPGSLYIANYFLRKDDKLYACELHPQDYEKLSVNTKLYKIKSKLYNEDGYGLVKSILPFAKIKRGIIFIDPPFEKTTEFDDLLITVKEGLKRMSNAIFVIWYPIKEKYDTKSFLQDIKNISKEFNNVGEILNVSLKFKHIFNALIGTGMLIINAPFKIEENIYPILEELEKLEFGDTQIKFL